MSMTPTLRKRTLVLLTAAYPFSRNWESFLESELQILATRFERIIILPSNTDEHVRALPPSVRCETFLADIDRRQLARELVRRPLRPLMQYARAIVGEGAGRVYARHPLPLLGFAAANRVRYDALEAFINAERLHDAVFYDYWLANSTLALSHLRRRGVIRRAVARAHGVDVYDEQQEIGTVPYRGFALRWLDRVFPISADGLAYLAAKHPAAGPKLVLSRLGVNSQAREHTPPLGDVPLVVSCGGLLSLKRTELIPAVLARVGTRLRWVHFGDGPEREKVQRAAASLPARIDWQLLGQVDHDAVVDFYRGNRVDLLLSMSASEGIPVSMMEAISFGVPIVATGVGGVPEIVTAETGNLFGVDDSIDVAADRVRDLLSGARPPQEQIIAFFEANFNATRNFNQFADALAEL
jgi:glycosyltransferase involved in cell wall biosynthesis